MGKPLDVYEPSSVKNRIQKWQEQGGGVIELSDESRNGSIREDLALQVGEITPRRNHHVETWSSHHPDEPNTPPCRRTTRRVHDSVRESGVRPRSAPSKRVVSDGHWRKKRSPPKSASVSRTIRKDSESLDIDEQVYTETSEGRPQTQQMKTESRERQERRERREKSRRRTIETPSFSDNAAAYQRDSMQTQSFDKVASHDCDHPQAPPNRVISANSVGRHEDRAITENETYPPISEVEPPKDDPFSRSEYLEHRRRCPTKLDEAEASATSIRNPKGRGSVRSERGNILSQVLSDSKKLFARQPPDSVITPRVPSIEAWLETTPDPFVEGETTPEQRSLSEERSGLEYAESDIGDVNPNDIRDGIGPKRASRGRIRREGNRKLRAHAPRCQKTGAISDGNIDAAAQNVLMGKEDTPVSTNSEQRSLDLTTPLLKRRAARKSVSSPVRRIGRSQQPLAAEPPEGNSSTEICSTNDSCTSTAKTITAHRSYTISKRRVPTTGQHQLSRIASMETLQNTPQSTPLPSTFVPTRKGPLTTSIHEESAIKTEPESALLRRQSSRLTKHSDLISVLSLPRGGSKSIRPARSVRTTRTRLEAATTEELSREIEADETKYMRELRTLVDGVIPVLLSCVLSKADSATAVNLFQPRGAVSSDPNFTKPIIDMGVALERLRSLHRRIPLQSHASLLTWAHGAQRVYAEYLRAWRLGFQDVVVNLASVTNVQVTTQDTSTADRLPRDSNGNVVDGDGEKVDVAFLLKRPLVRLKYLARTIRGISLVSPSSEATDLAQKYEILVESARERVEEERARLEDEAAANVDATRARDPRTLAPLNGVCVESGQRVQARDHFNCTLQHSSGQCIDCRVELILREDPEEAASRGDILICEVDSSGRWLLFPPIQNSLVSARNGDRPGEVIVMLRGYGGDGNEWQEILTLHGEDIPTSFEWASLLGTEPVPPRLSRSQSFIGKERIPASGWENVMPHLAHTEASKTSFKSRTPSPREIEIPIGEKASNNSKRWSCQASENDVQGRSSLVVKDRDVLHGDMEVTRRTRSIPLEVNDLQSLPSHHRPRSKALSPPPTRTPRSFKEALGLSGTSALSGLRRTKAKRQSRHLNDSPTSMRSRSSRHDSESCDSSPWTSEVSVRPSEYKVRIERSSVHSVQLTAAEPTEKICVAQTGEQPPGRSESGQESQTLLSSSPAYDSDDPSRGQKAQSSHHKLPDSPTVPHTPVDVEEYENRRQKTEAGQSLTPVRGSKVSLYQGHVNGSNPPIPVATEVRARPSSSPLKNQYEPSIASEASDCSSTSDASTVHHNESSSMTSSSDDEDLEAGDVSTPLVPPLVTRRPFPPISQVPPNRTLEDTLKPSDSASQAPYKSVPIQRQDAAKTIALIFSWSEQGSWDNLHPDECSIVVSPGLIEAFEMSAAHSNARSMLDYVPWCGNAKFPDDASNTSGRNDEVRGERPLVALELTPLVPLRRGTAIDISIRSPPTANSQVTTGDNIMFRSRSPEECEALYALINHARIHNPTYIALQNARGPFATGSQFVAAGSRRTGSQAGSARHSWFGGFGRSSSYRVRSKRPSSASPSESSVGTMSSAFSALRRFGRGSGGGTFNIALSTITSRNGGESGPGSVYSISDNSSGSGIAAPSAPGMVANTDGSLGLKDAKIRFYGRETASKWRDMGSARLTILQPENRPNGLHSMNGESQQPVHQKRILIHGKTKGEVLLDVQLGESCFERVARTGIAVSVWEDVVGPNGEVGVVGAVGGVAGGTTKVYMIQMKNEAETAYTFSLVGKLRY